MARLSIPSFPRVKVVVPFLGFFFLPLTLGDWLDSEITYWTFNVDISSTSLMANWGISQRWQKVGIGAVTPSELSSDWHIGGCKACGGGITLPGIAAGKISTMG